MSFIQSTIQCIYCGKEMNVSTGTFGAGLPKDCPACKRELNYKVIPDGWHANGNIMTTTLREEFKKFVQENLPKRVAETPEDAIADWFLERTVPKQEILQWCEENKRPIEDFEAIESKMWSDGYNVALADLT